ncbi:Protein serine/threonine phosphatase [Candidatus Sulfobium mesophilum]|uniref:Protein serine/threonine phosphatase n=1 Tax=Candidatus Sulfobium mesophilum TaxID=2016548 RepID=A0A2U3QGF4_9BACT|nr:Protein serine/threonine phosphatase [Candidatus Sulfobium mesophilum]
MLNNRSLAFKLILFFTLSSGVILLVVLAYDYWYSRKMIENDLEESARHLVSSTVNKLDAVLAPVQKVPENLACFLENATFSEKEVISLLRVVVERNPDIYGAAVAFEPGVFVKGRRHFAPYFYRTKKGLEFSDLGASSYDYFAKDWYQIPKELGGPQWSEPYFDEGGGNILMSTYSVPFYRTKGGKRYLAGVVTADISLEWLKKVVSSVKILKTGYGILTSRNGTIITHPSEKLVMNETIFSAAEEKKDKRLREIGQRMIRGESGFGPFITVSGRESWACYAPVSSTGWTLSVVFPRDELYSDINRLQGTAGLLAAAGILLLSFVIVLISRSISRPLRAMAKATEEMARGNLDMPVPAVRSRDEVGVLAESFSRMGESLKKYIRDLTEATAAKERIESELSIAHDIQMSIIPKTFPAFPDRKEFDICAFIEPAREVGGDFYDFFFINATHLCFVIADVSGKGVPSALFMAEAMTLIKVMAKESLSPDQILCKVNNELCTDNSTGMFVTIFLGILDTITGEVLYSNGGHNPPLTISRDGKAEFLKVSPGLVAGAWENFQYVTGRLFLKKGETLFMYTDGVTEAMNPADELFSEERLLRNLMALSDKPLAEILGRLTEEIIFFAQGAPQSDDITMMALRFTGGSGN